MKCEEIRERMLDLAAGLGEPTAAESHHLASCGSCAAQWKAMRETMTLLDEWQVPEPSPFFDVRLQARLREEMAQPRTNSLLRWFRQPVLAAALTVMMGIGVGVFFTQGRHMSHPPTQVADAAQPGTAVSDLQTLDKNHDLYADFDLLDDLDVQQDVTANP
ncbi:MAG TPA: hypothetical protein VFA67_05150 [Candidatus Sulfotelmatobacter sp.]|nr:hypothetical protein [Candidatus Sulfotelmatobacter sp.]